MSSWPGGAGGSSAAGGGLGAGAGAGAGAGLGGGGLAVCADAPVAVKSATSATLPHNESLRLLPHPMFTLHKPRPLKGPGVYQ